MDTYEAEVKSFLASVHTEVMRARKLFPSPDGLLTALTEETGEVAKAMLDEPWDAVRTETIQTAAMCCRLALEGDPTLDGVRAKRVVFSRSSDIAPFAMPFDIRDMRGCDDN